jgi:hypothetical protein
MGRIFFVGIVMATLAAALSSTSAGVLLRHLVELIDRLADLADAAALLRTGMADLVRSGRSRASPG